MNKLKIVSSVEYLPEELLGTLEFYEEIDGKTVMFFTCYSEDLSKNLAVLEADSDVVCYEVL